MSPRMAEKMAIADWLNPGIYKVFRGKRPGLYLANARRISEERFNADPNPINAYIFMKLFGP